jgi:hypothetical protein
MMIKRLATVWPRAISLRRAAGILGLFVCWASLSGCDTTAPVDNTAMLPENQRVSTVPWNKPESWEGRGQLGALANNPRFTGGN